MNGKKRFFLKLSLIMVLISVTWISTWAVETCEKYGLISVKGGEYIIQNNCWGSDARQCISVPDTNSTGFTITASQHNQGNVASYPSIFKGCHWDTCTNGWTSIRVGSLANASYSWSVSTEGVTGTYDVAAEAWFSPSADCSTGYDQGLEMMIWMDAKGIVPAGSKVGTYGPFEVWYGSMSDGVNTWKYVCYYRVAETTADIDLMGFMADSISRGYLSASFYLHDIEAGFELMTNGQGLKLNSFTATITGGGSGPKAGPTPTPEPKPSTDNPCGGRTSVEKTLPFVFDGSGKYCWTFSSTPEYINSNNMEVLSVNGVDFSNDYITAANLPPRINGKYYVYYKGNWDWSHFNAANPVANEPTPGVTATVTRTPTPSVTRTPTLTPSRTRTPPINGLLGDANDDGIITIVDALMTAQYSVGLNPAGFNSKKADVSCSGDISIVDALIIAQYSVGLISYLACS